MDARRADVMERDGTVLVRKSNGDWLFLRKNQSNPNAFVLEGEYGDKHLLQLDTRVSGLLFQPFAETYCHLASQHLIKECQIV